MSLTPTLVATTTVATKEKMTDHLHSKKDKLKGAQRHVDAHAPVAVEQCYTDAVQERPVHLLCYLTTASLV